MALTITDKFGRPPVYGPDGMVAMRYLHDNRLLVECGGEPPRGRQYVFHMRFNIAFSWVAEQDVPCCLAVVGGCCGNIKPGIIVFATKDDIRRWSGESER